MIRDALMTLHFPLLVALALAGVAGTQQTTSDERPATPHFQVGVDLVPVDVSVLDRKGNPVLDLQRSDFTVLEDGVEQDVLHFSLERFATRSEPELPPAVTRERPAVEGLERPDFRRFLIVIGRGGHETFRPIDALADFVRESLGPADQIAVIAYNRATDFTTDHERIGDFLDRLQDLNVYVDRLVRLRFDGLASLFGSQRFPPSLQPKIDALFDQLPGHTREVPAGPRTPDKADQADRENLMTALREAMPGRLDEARRAVAGPGAGERWDGSGPPPYGDPAQSWGRVSAEDDSFEQYVRHRLETNQDLLNIFAGIEYLRYLQGEKHLIYFSSGGLFLPTSGTRESIGRIAADARVRIDCFKTEGLFLHLTNDRRNRFAQGSVAGDYAIRSLQEVSRETGGTSCIHRSIDDALKLVGRATSRVYLLGYVSKNPALDGRFREIQVKVDRPGVRVLARSGYFAKPRLQPYDRQRMLIYARVTAATQHPGEIDDVTFSASMGDLSREKESTEFDVSLEIVLSPELVDGNSPNRGQKLVAGLFVLSRSGELLDTSWKDIVVDPSGQRSQGAASSSVEVGWRAEVPRKIKNGFLKIVLYDPSRDRVGSRVVKIR